MRLAIPLTNGVLAQHFGHCERFALLEVDVATRAIVARTEVEAPEHKPGLLPVWLKERGVTHVIAGSMGSRARSLFAEVSIHVITGAKSEPAIAVAGAYMAGALVTGANTCDH